MPAPFQLPGYYWDEARQKFFKVESAATAPEGAAWASGQVREHDRRRRQTEEHRMRRERLRQGPVWRGGQGEERKRDQPQQEQRQPGVGSNTGIGTGQQSLRALARLATPILRSSVWTNPLVGGVLARELGGHGRACGADCSDIYEGSRSRGLSSSSSGSGSGSGSACCRSWMSAGAIACARALCYHGQVDILHGNRMLVQPQQLPSLEPVTSMYVHSYDDGDSTPGGHDEPSGLGLVYTNCSSTNGPDVKGQYIPRDSNDFIPSSWPTSGRYARYSQFARTRPEGLGASLVSAICYHRPSNHMIVTSREPFAGDSVVQSQHETRGGAGTDRGSVHPNNEVPFIQIFSPHQALVDDPGPAWRVGGNFDGTDDSKDVVRIYSGKASDAAYACAAAPRSAGSGRGLLCVAGAERGLILINLERVAAQAVRQRQIATRGGKWYMSDSMRLNAPDPDGRSRGALISSVDFFDGHPDLVLAGGRQAAPWLVDLREPGPQRCWHSFGCGGGGSKGDGQGEGDGNGKRGQVRNAVAHVQYVGGHRVLAAGLRDSMVLYDVRYLAEKKKAAAGAPVLRFSGYANKARLFGLPVAVEPRLGLVAVGSELVGSRRSGDSSGSRGYGGHTGASRGARLGEGSRAVDSYETTTGSAVGGVSLFSLATGERLWPGRDLASLGGGAFSRSRPQPDAGYNVQALSFAQLPGDRVSSLFVGCGPHVKKYSLSAGGEDIYNDLCYHSDDDDEDDNRIGNSGYGWYSR